MENDLWSLIQFVESDGGNKLSQYISQEKAKAYEDKSLRGTLDSIFWRYARSCMGCVMDTKITFTTYLRHFYWENRENKDFISDEVRQELDEVLWPRPYHINRGLQGWFSQWDYLDTSEDSKD